MQSRQWKFVSRAPSAGLQSVEHQTTGAAGKGTIMKTIEDIQKVGKDNVDAAMKSMGVVSKSFQAIAVEMADYSKKAFEEGAAATEKLFGAKSLEKAMEVQSDYFKSAYESFVAESAKLGELYSELAQETYKPFEGFLSKAAVMK
jgi:hypothetical protein